MTKQIVKWLILLATARQRMQSGRNATDVAKLKMSLIYLKMIKACRFLCVSMLGIGITLILLLMSLLLFNLSLIFFTPYSDTTKLWIGLGSAAIYFGIAVWTFNYVFSHQKWLEIFGGDKILKKVSGDMARSQTMAQ